MRLEGLKWSRRVSMEVFKKYNPQLDQSLIEVFWQDTGHPFPFYTLYSFRNSEVGHFRLENNDVNKKWSYADLNEFWPYPLQMNLKKITEVPEASSTLKDEEQRVDLSDSFDIFGGRIQVISATP